MLQPNRSPDLVLVRRALQFKKGFQTRILENRVYRVQDLVFFVGIPPLAFLMPYKLYFIPARTIRSLIETKISAPVIPADVILVQQRDSTFHLRKQKECSGILEKALKVQE